MNLNKILVAGIGMVFNLLLNLGRTNLFIINQLAFLICLHLIYILQWFLFCFVFFMWILHISCFILPLGELIFFHFFVIKYVLLYYTFCLLIFRVNCWLLNTYFVTCHVSDSLISYYSLLLNSLMFLTLILSSANNSQFLSFLIMQALKSFTRFVYHY